MAAGINPLALQMQQLQRRQQIADMLQQQGMTPDQQQTIGGAYPVVVRQSPFQGISKIAQAAIGAGLTRANDQRYRDIANQMMAAQKSSIAGLAGGGQSAAPADTSSSMPPESIRAPGYTPPAAPTASAPTLGDTLEAAQNASNYGVSDEVIKAALADRARTEQMKNDAATGIAPGERGNLTRRESIKQAFVPGSGGMLDIDPATGQPVFRTLPGLAESTANAAGLSTAATEANKPHYEPDPFHPGKFSVTYATPPALGTIGRGGAVPQAGGASPGGGTRADLESQIVGAKTGQDFSQSLNERAEAAVQGKRALGEMGNLLQGFEPGKGAPILAGLGSAAVALGVPSDTVTNLTNVNPGDAEAFQKQTAALATEAAKQVSSRTTQMEFKTFLANNPNWMMTPQGIKRVMDYMGKGFDANIDQQHQFAQWSKTHSPDRWAIDFPDAYNQQRLRDIGSGRTNSAPASLTGTRTRTDTTKAAGAQGGAVAWPKDMTIDQARTKYPKGTVFTFPDGSQGSL